MKQRMADNVLLWFSRSVALFALISLIHLLYYSNTLNVSLSEWLIQAKRFYFYLLSWSDGGRDVHPSYTAIIVLMSIASAIYLRFNPASTQKVSSVELCINVILSSIFIIFTGSRIATLILPLLLLLTLFIFLPFRKWVNGCIVIGILITGIFILKMTTHKIMLKDPIRIQLNLMAIDAIKERPLIGHGTGAQKDIIQSMDRAQKLGYEEIFCSKCVHPHNQFLSEILQYGIPLGLIMPALLLCMFGIRKNFLLFAFLLIEIGFMTVEGPLDTQKGVTFFSYFSIFLIVLQYAEQKKTQ
jgi:O-antigen ligase